MLIKKMTGEDIKALRKSLGLNQEDFARKFRIPISTLRHLEQDVSEIKGLTLTLFNILNQLTKRKCSTQDFLFELLYEPKTQRRKK